MTPKPIYDKGGITVYCDRAENVIPYLGRFDLCLMDPNYGIGADNRKQILSRSNVAAARDYGESYWDDEPADAETLAMALNLANSAIVWGGNYFAFPPSPCWLVWDKDNTGDFADCELAWTNLKRAVRKFKYRWNGMLQEHGGNKKETRVHPTQKPLALMQWCLSLVPDAKTVLDPYAGSLTTLAAAKLAGLRAVGIEQSPEYCRKGIERLRQGVLELTG